MLKVLSKCRSLVFWKQCHSQHRASLSKCLRSSSPVCVRNPLTCHIRPGRTTAPFPAIFSGFMEMLTTFLEVTLSAQSLFLKMVDFKEYWLVLDSLLFFFQSADFLIKLWIASHHPPHKTDDYFQQGWVYLHPSLYYVSPDKKSWSKSREDCLQRQSDLLILSNDLEQVRISKHIALCFSRLRVVFEDRK